MGLRFLAHLSSPCRWTACPGLPCWGLAQQLLRDSAHYVTTVFPISLTGTVPHQQMSRRVASSHPGLREAGGMLREAVLRDKLELPRSFCRDCSGPDSLGLPCHLPRARALHQTRIQRSEVEKACVRAAYQERRIRLQRSLPAAGRRQPPPRPAWSRWTPANSMIRSCKV